MSRADLEKHRLMVDNLLKNHVDDIHLLDVKKNIERHLRRLDIITESKERNQARERKEQEKIQTIESKFDPDCCKVLLEYI